MTTLLAAAVLLLPQVQATDEVVQVEHDFARLVARAGMAEGFLEYMDERCVLFQPGPVAGVDFLLRQERTPGIIEWEPRYAGIDSRREIAFTVGPYQFKPDGAVSQPESFGWYVSVWRQSAGVWKLLLHARAEGPEVSVTAGNVRQIVLPPGVDRGEPELLKQDAALDRALATPKAVPTLDPSVLVIASGTTTAFGARDGLASLQRLGQMREFKNLAFATAQKGDLAHTYGSFEVRGSVGHSVRIWRRGAGRQWVPVAIILILPR